MQSQQRFRYAAILAALLLGVTPLAADEKAKPEGETIFLVEMLFRQEGVWFLGQAAVPARKESRPEFRAVGFDAKGQPISPDDPGFKRVERVLIRRSDRAEKKDLPLADEMHYYWARWDDHGLALCASDQGFHPKFREDFDRSALYPFQDALFRVTRMKTTPEPLRQDLDDWQKRTKEILAQAIAAGDSRVRAWLVAQGEAEEAELLLPRLADHRGNRFEQHDGLSEALEKVPSLIARDEMFGFGFGKGDARTDGFLMRASFDPAQADVGDVTKAVNVLRGAGELRSQPPAILLVRTAPGVERKAAELERIWTSLAEVEGVDVKSSRDLVAGHILGVVLKPDGKAKLRDIRAAMEAAGVQLERGK